NAADNITLNSTRLNGTVNPNGVNVTSCYFQYGTSTSYGITATVTSLPSGTIPVSVTANVSSLLATTTYNFRVAATSAAGTTNGNNLTFITTVATFTITFNPTSTGRTGNITTWTVTATGVYRIEVWGAQGGNGNSLTGGLGARMRGDFNLTTNDQIRILVGQQGLNAGSAQTYGGNGGGGGTFVQNQTTSTLLIAAGGGGGAGGNGSGQNGYNGLTEQSGGTGGGGTSGAGGTNGQGGGRGNYAGGGAGWLSNGVTNVDGGGSTYNNFGGIRFLEGGYGGDEGSDVYSGWGGNYGGFGGGGAGGLSGGGGGGYSGGGGGGGWSPGYAGGGGGSYNNGTNQSNSAGVRQGAGLVTITFNP
ncbi:MAG: hypothetical protein V1871_07995, partial [Planctomycetota bacterium]